MDLENKDNKNKSKISRKLNDFLYEEEGNISRGKILTIGSLMLVAGLIFANNVFAAHRSHSSHSSHSSHVSGASSGHSSHASHESHSSHVSSSTHSSHSSSSTTTTTTPAATHSSLPTFRTPQNPGTTPAM